MKEQHWILRDLRAGARMSSSDKFGVVYRGFDPMWAGMLADALRVEGIDCQHFGTRNPSSIEAGALACEQRLEVPLEDMERATALVQASTSSSPAALDDD